MGKLNLKNSEITLRGTTKGKIFCIRKRNYSRENEVKFEVIGTIRGVSNYKVIFKSNSEADAIRKFCEVFDRAKRLEELEASRNAK